MLSSWSSHPGKSSAVWTPGVSRERHQKPFEGLCVHKDLGVAYAERERGLGEDNKAVSYSNKDPTQ